MRYRSLAVLGANSFAGAGFIPAALDRFENVTGINRSAEGPDFFLPYKKHQRREHYRFVQADINLDQDRILALLDEIKPEVVVDLAGQGMVAESWGDPAQWYQTNVLAKVRILEQLRRRPWLKRYVRVSTPEVYGSHDQPITEDAAYRPSTPYAISHAAIDMHALALHRQYGFPVLLARFANFYGPGQQLYRIVPRTILYSKSRRKLPLHGGGTSVRAFIHVSDVAQALCRTIECGVAGETYHFSPNSFLSIRDAVTAICDELKQPFAALVQESADRPGKDHAYLMDSAKARAALEWREEFDFREGVRQTIGWIETHFASMQSLSWDYIHKT
ncbi:MAG: GDP-mannose 4,6-dehydratase [Burkholderiales bacterium]